MKRPLLDILICPACLPQEIRLSCEAEKTEGEEILSGLLACPSCGATYPVDRSLACLLPGPERHGPKDSRYEEGSLLASYLWSHYGDLMGDIEATGAYDQWSGLMDPIGGLALDAGCAVGRFAFEMSERADFVIGIDTSFSFASTARHLMETGASGFSLPEEGLLMEHRTVNLPARWTQAPVEFILADAQALPFASNTFHSVSSLNLVDKIPRPLAHLKEVSRVSRNRHSQFLFSDPFSWSSAVTPQEHWLGGTQGGPYPGEGLHNISSLLTGAGGEVFPPWRIERRGSIWWRLRNHRNHYELVRSCFIKAAR